MFCRKELRFAHKILWHEFLGLVRLPKWGHLRDLHKAIKMCEQALLYGEPTFLSLGTLQEVFSSAICPSMVITIMPNITAFC